MWRRWTQYIQVSSDIQGMEIFGRVHTSNSIYPGFGDIEERIHT
jgi:hypothetical protein